MRRQWLGRTMAVLLMAGSLSNPLLASEDIGSKLPPDVRALLIQEMVAILQSTQTIVAAVVRGEDQLVAEEAQHIHDSFILAQQMSEQQEQALLAAASKEFLERDEAFHKLSATLAEAARAGDQPRQLTLVQEMLNACVACHTEHAAQRFPTLGKP